MQTAIRALLALALLGTLSMSALAGAQPLAAPIDVLVIDETKTVSESVCVEFLARAMAATGLFTLSARLDIPGPNASGKRYDLIVIVPEKIRQVWLVSADIPARLAPELAQAIGVIKEAAKMIYSGGDCAARQPVHTADDFAPAIYAAILLRGGWLNRPGD